MPVESALVDLATQVRAERDVRVHGGRPVGHEKDEAVGCAVEEARVAAPAGGAHFDGERCRGGAGGAAICLAADRRGRRDETRLPTRARASTARGAGIDAAVGAEYRRAPVRRIVGDGGVDIDVGGGPSGPGDGLDGLGGLDGKALLLLLAA